MIRLCGSTTKLNSSPLPSPLRGEGEYFSPPRSRNEFFPRPFRERARVRVLIWLMLTLVIWPPVAFAQVVKSVETVGMTVSDMDRSVEFFSKVLSFEQVSDIEVYGPESSGKTTLALHVIAEAQRGGGTAAFVDAEHALDPVYAKKLGVNVTAYLRDRVTRRYALPSLASLIAPPSVLAAQPGAA